MSDTLPQADGYRTTQQIGELQTKITMAVERVLREIRIGQKRIASIKEEIANRWKSVDGISFAERNQLAQQETVSRVRDVIKSVTVTLDGELKEVYALYQEITAARVFYPGKLQLLMNITVSSHDRAKYAAILAAAGPVELASYAAYAIGTQDMALAAATLQANDALPSKDRRFQSVEIVSRIALSSWDSVQAALKQADAQFQQALIAVRTFKAARPSPVDTMRLAMMKGKLKLNEDGSIDETGTKAV